MRMAAEKYLLRMIWASVVLSGVSSSVGLADDGDNAVDIVRCTEIAFSYSVENRDKKSFRQFLDPDARFVGRSVLRGPDEIVNGWSVFLDNDYPRILWRPDVVEVLADGKLALSRGPYVLTSLDEDGNQVESWGTFNSIWRRAADGNWHVVFDAGSEGSGPVPDSHRERLNGLNAAC